jgi:plastocyanin
MSVRIALVTVAAALLSPSAVAQAENPRLTAVVGTNNAFVISLRDASGGAITRLEPGTYDIAVSDRSEMHNFHLKGPSVDFKTDPEAVENVVWTVTFTDGRYGYMCDPHAATMRSYFLVGDVATQSFAGSVGPKAKIALAPRSALPGPASFKISDRSRTDNFHLTGPGVNKKTGVASRSSATWNVNLAPGVYRYRSDKHPKLRGTLTVRFPA